MSELTVGDEVEWNTPQGVTHGTVVEVMTEPGDVKGQHLDASPDDPRYVVRSDKTGALAGHTAGALRKRT